jgi:hypothetical protein
MPDRGSMPNGSVPNGSFSNGNRAGSVDPACLIKIVCRGSGDVVPP